MDYYIASKLENAPLVKKLKAALDAAGWNHTYDWTVHGSVAGQGSRVIAEVASNEVSGVARARCVIGLLHGGRGTHWELGLAQGLRTLDIVENREPRRIILASFTPHIDFSDSRETCAFYHQDFVEKVWLTRHVYKDDAEQFDHGIKLLAHYLTDKPKNRTVYL